MTVYFGSVGSLVALADPIHMGVEPGISVPGGTHQLLGGGRVRDRVGTPRRTYTVRWEHITQDQAGAIGAFYLGAYGLGPFVLLDPNRRNMLSTNQSTGTDALRATTGFVAVSGTVSTSTTLFNTGLRSLAWAVTAADQRVMTGVTASISGATSDDVPVVPTLSYTAQVRGRLSASTGTIRVDLHWFTTAGAVVSVSTGSAVAQATGSFTQATCTATAPSTAALVRVAVTNTAMGAAQTIYLDDWCLEQASSASTWLAGTGVPRVAFDSFNETYPFGTYRSVEAVLLEV